MFQSGNVKRMKDIEKQTPTNVAAVINMNHGRYIKKLYNPEEFKVKQIIEFAKLLDLDPLIIFKVIAEHLKSKR
jgi:hypothetical protein